MFFCGSVYQNCKPLKSHLDNCYILPPAKRRCDPITWCEAVVRQSSSVWIGFHEMLVFQKNRGSHDAVLCCPAACMSVRLPVHMSVRPPACPSACPSTFPFGVRWPPGNGRRRGFGKLTNGVPASSRRMHARRVVSCQRSELLTTRRASVGAYLLTHGRSWVIVHSQ